ncbi:MAG: hypothetical protein JXB85_08280 [Anaerolineales bacterium]|nr:hypothetical protein [Anaerolineales bacterium]
MLAALSWYLLVSLLGLLTFPLAYRLFPGLADRGYSLARTVGLLVWGYVFWVMVSLGLAANTIGGLLLALAILTGISTWAVLDSREGGMGGLFDWLKSNLRMVLTTEMLFLVAFALMAVVRAANPETVGTEKPMELAFINGILRSPTFPPRDPWLSGYAISYYYFGYVITAMLARLTGVLGSVAFNLMLALVFALGAIGAYGILYTLLALWDRRHPSIEDRKPSLGFPLFAPLFLLIVSNLEGFLELLHRRGLFWSFSGDGSANSAFWTWLEMKELSMPPNQFPGWVPERYMWWWRASRVVQDFDLAGNWTEVIDEFPFFSFLLGDLHPHVLAIPFGLLVVALALNLFLGGLRGETNLFNLRLPISRSGFVFTAVLVGGMAFMNTWDMLFVLALVGGGYLLGRVRRCGWSWLRLEEVLAFGIPMGVLAVLLYLPYFAAFSSQAGGILPNLVNVTRGAHLWVMFGSLLLPVFAYLLYLRRREKHTPAWGLGFGIAAGVVVLLWSLSWLLGLVAQMARPDLAVFFLDLQDAVDIGTLFCMALKDRLYDFGGWMTLLVLLATTLAFLAGFARRQDQGLDGDRPAASSAHGFVLFLVLLAGLLVLAPEYIYLRDQFGTRMNTIFKFYYQAWMLWSLAAAFGAAVMLQNLRPVWDWLYRVGLILVLAMGLTYPVLSLLTKTNNFAPYLGWSLDGAAHLDYENPADADAIRWFATVPDGIVAEAASPGGSYTYYGRIATYTGLPNVLGWPGHEGQWRGGYEPQGNRLDDLRRLYTTNSWEEARAILQQHDIRYVVVGPLERSTYRVDETKFQRFLVLVFQNSDVRIYAVP